MSVTPGPNAIFVYTGIRLPAQFATDNGVNQEITVKGATPGTSQTVRTVGLLCLLFSG